jgi:hypothetical protein
MIASIILQAWLWSFSVGAPFPTGTIQNGEEGPWPAKQAPKERRRAKTMLIAKRIPVILV